MMTTIMLCRLLRGVKNSANMATEKFKFRDEISLILHEVRDYYYDLQTDSEELEPEIIIGEYEMHVLKEDLINYKIALVNPEGEINLPRQLVQDFSVEGSRLLDERALSSIISTYKKY